MENVKPGLCRLCAVQKESVVEIYEEEGHKLNLESKITKCLQIDLLTNDVLPKSVCLDCCANLNQCFDFCERSTQAQLTLHMIFAETKTEEMDVHDMSGVVEEEYESGLSVDGEEEEEEEDEEEEEEEDEEGEENLLGLANPTPPEYVECVLSDSQGAGIDGSSKRKCRLPMRVPLLPKDEEEEGEGGSKMPRKAKIDSTLANRAIAATSNEDSTPRKRRDGWEKYPWLCTDCDQELPSMQALRTHHNTIHNQPARFMCAECSKVYSKYYGFVSHVRRHRNYLKFCCEECGKCFSNKKVLESHRATHSDARPFVCSECGKTFRQQSALYVHNRSHQPDDVKNKYPCDQCDKRFSTKPNLVTHKRIHTGVRNFTCDQCGKSFIQKGNLDAHLLTHSHEKPHSCPICNKGFKTPLQLRKHHTVHTGAKPHQCDVCGRQFRERGTLREHHRIHTGAMPFTCEFCNKAFRFKGILTTHRRQHTGERPYSCIECQHHFTNWPNYNKHMKRRHGINTSHQPDPNKLAMAAHKALLAAQPPQQSYTLEEERFYALPPYAPVQPVPAAMMGYYGVPGVEAVGVEMMEQHR